MFFFHTPYYGYDSLFVEKTEKQAVIDTLLIAKSDGLPVLNSAAGLNAIATNAYKHPTIM